MKSKFLRPRGPGRYVFLCDHASNDIPEELRDLGLPAEELARHIAWDIGSAGVTEMLSAIFNAPAILCGTSRLVVDCNRQPGSEDIIPATSDGTMIPGNQDLSDHARKIRVEKWFYPYHDDVEMVLEARGSKEVKSIVVSVHSMTRSLRSDGQERPWQISLSSDTDRTLSDPILAALREPGDVVVGDNEPYNMDPAIDYSIPFHALRRGLPFIQVEFRQDEVADGSGQRAWAVRFAQALTKVVA